MSIKLFRPSPSRGHSPSRGQALDHWILHQSGGQALDHWIFDLQIQIFTNTLKFLILISESSKMARSKRHHYPGCFYHVMLRGNHKQDIFFTETDRYNMCFLLQEGIEKYGHRIHSYCFMNNHIHLLIQVGDIPLSKIMQNLAFRYSQKINRKYKILGHLFQGRFKSIVIQQQVYFTRLLRYIHMNPVRAGITDKPENYTWSSHNAYINQKDMHWVTCDFGLSKFDPIRSNAIKHYVAYVSETESPEELKELRQDFKEGQILGDDDFLNMLKTQNLIPVRDPLSIESIIQAVCEELTIKKEFVVSPGKSPKAAFARSLISKLALDTGKISMVTLAEYLNRDPSTISGLLSKFHVNHNDSKEIQAQLDRLKQKALQNIQ